MDHYTITYKKTFYDHTPPYINKLIFKYDQIVTIRSSSKCIFVPEIWTNRYGTRSFAYAVVVYGMIV